CQHSGPVPPAVPAPWAPAGALQVVGGLHQKPTLSAFHRLSFPLPLSLPDTIWVFACLLRGHRLLCSSWRPWCLANCWGPSVP
uniref:Uncharacterized protein n=1 Tax=Lynx canadensis TaxID=61383 RepID=A0A667GIS7_LYNCA